MRSIVRRSILIALLAGFVAHGASAQGGSSAPDSATARPTPAAPNRSGAVPGTTAGVRSNNVLPAVEITGFLALLSAYDRVAYANVTQDGKKVYSSTWASTWDHLRTQHWVYDQDPFNTNQFQHPYQGATMYGLARSSGHSFWTSLIHANVGSFIWKMAGETDPPSINDMITTGQAGSLLGEALYRMADLVLKDGGGDNPSRLHEFGAALISPPGGLNRTIFGDRYKGTLPETAPARGWQLSVGATVDALAQDVSSPTTLLRRDATFGIAMSYGLPGQPGYEYTRPLDYFDFQFSALSNASNPIENIMLRGLLVGGKTTDSENSRGIWGLYGSYDYISPYLFRVSSTAVSLGTTRQYWFGPDIALQGSFLGGVGYGAAGSTVAPTTASNETIRDYHFGVTPQALLALRFLIGDRAMLDMTGREYYVSGWGSDDTRGSETIFRGNFGLTVRVYGGNAIGVQYVESTRNAVYGNQPDRKLSEGTISVVYSILGGDHFSAVKWR
jgi:hypothetical protein